MTKNINARKIRAHHRIIAVLREFAPNPMPVSVLWDRFGNDPTAVNLLHRPNAWVQYACKPCDSGVDEKALISKSTRGLKDQTYTLHNAFAFDASGRRYGNADGTRLLTDAEILKLIEDGFEMTSNGVSLPVAPVEIELTHEDVLRNLANNTNIILAENLFPSDEVVNTVDDSALDESVAFHVAVDPVVDDTNEEESNDIPEIVDYTELTDMSFDMGNTDIPAFVAEKPKPVRHRDANGKMISRARAIELGIITAEAA